MANSEIRLNPVKSLSVKYFKGIADEQTIEFDKNGKIVVLLGENGTGKSSFVYALEYLFRQKLDILKPITVDKKSYIHQGYNDNDWEINLCLGPDCIVLNNNGFKANKSIRKVIRNNRFFFDNALFVLNRAKLLDFIENSEGEKYSNFSTFCGFDDIEMIQKALSSSENLFNKEFSSKSKDIDNLFSDFDEDLIINDENDFIKIINENLISLNKDEIDETTNLKDYLNSLELSSEVYIVGDNINQFLELYDNLDVSKLNNELNEIIQGYEQIGLDSVNHLKNMSDILTLSKDYFESSNSDICPVCGNDVDKEILDDIDNKLSELNNSLSKYNEWKNNVKEFIFSLNGLKSNYENILTILNNLSKYLDLNKEIKVFEENNKSILDLIDDLNKLVKVKISILELNDKYDLNIEDDLNALKNRLIDYNRQLKGDNIKKLSFTKDLINKLILFKDLTKEMNLLKQKYELNAKINETFKQTKEEYINELIGEIEDDVDDFYNFIHDDDLIKSPLIEHSGSSKLRIYLDSFGNQTDPRSFSSEGHLDTLGLCIFLAFMKRFNPLKFIVLDDVIMSVDLSHKDKVAKLLVSKFDDYRILITTHNGLWAEQLRRIGKYYKNQVRILQIIKWDLTSGPYIKPTKDIDEKIKEYLGSGDFNAAGNASRRYYEFTLCEFCENNAVNIKLKDKYMVSDLDKAVKDKSLELARNNEELSKFYEHIWSNLKMHDYIGNKLSHHNKDSLLLTGSEIGPFCKSVCELNNALKCCNCPHNDELIFDEETKEVTCSGECRFI